MKRLLPILMVLLSACSTFHADKLPDAPKDATFKTLQNTHVRYVDEGEGYPVTFLHGFASSTGVWSDIMPKVQATGRRTIALDLKGFGWTSRPEGDYSPQAQAQMTWALLDELGVQQTDLVGHSWGTSVVLQMALQQPDRVRRIVLYDAWVYEEQLPTFFVWSRADGIGEVLFDMFYKERPDEKMARAFYAPERYINEKFVENVEGQLDRPGTVAAALEAVRGQDYAAVQGDYKKINKPVLLLWGREDNVTLLTFGERLHNELPNAKLIVYPQCGHFPMIEARGASTRDLIDFINADQETPHLESLRTNAPTAAPQEPPTKNQEPKPKNQEPTEEAQ